VIRAALVLALLALAVSACGSGGAHPTACPQTQKALLRIDRDLAALRAAAKLPTKSTLTGNAAINAATDRFLNDVALAPISNLQRNRLIDHAMAALVGNCEQCFQALEAERPIPAIRSGDSKCPTGA
jgi:hypothetical protein